jgi:hypothetical protein
MTYTPPGFLEVLHGATDDELRRALDGCVADLALAEKYEHNAHLRPTIRSTFDSIRAEIERRASAPTPDTAPLENRP